jgi:hypothetical protein
VFFLKFLVKTDSMLLTTFMSIFKDTPVTAGNAKLFLTNFPNEARSVPTKVKKQVCYEQEYKCSECNVLMNATYEVDHITPLYMGGSNNQCNLQALCRNCHGDKTVKDETDFSMK